MWPFKSKQQPEPLEPRTEEAHPDIYSVLSELDGDAAAVARQYIEEHTPPAPPVPEGVAMDSACQPVSMGVNYEALNPLVYAHYVATGQFIGYPAMAVIAQNWLIRKGCEAKPRDAVRQWYDIGVYDGELDEEQIQRIELLDRRYDLKRNLVEALTLNNIFGIRHVFFKHRNPDFDYSRPFNPDDFRDGQYAGIAQIDPNRVTPEFRNEDLTDPASMHYLEPTWWLIGTRKVHRSHLVVLTGDMVPDVLKPMYRYGGISLTQKVYERVYAAERTANEAPKLTMTKRLTWRKTDLDQVAAKPGKFARAMQRLTDYRNNYGVELIGKNEEIGQHDTALTDLQNVIMGQYQLVCSALDVPASKLLGTGHQGFSTGEADIDYYIESLQEMQANELTDLIDAHYRRLIPSYADSIGCSPDTALFPKWRPMKVMSDAEIADINLKNRQADQLAWNMQAVSNEEVRDRIRADRFAGYEGLEPLTDDEELDIDGEEAEENTAIQ